MRVDFLARTNVIGSLANSSYAGSFTNPPLAANLMLTTRATDNSGGVGVSPGVSLNVHAPGLILLNEISLSPGCNVNLLLSSPDEGRKFRMEYSVDLKNWTAIGIAENTNGTMDFTHTIPSNEPAGFYRSVLATQ